MSLPEEIAFRMREADQIHFNMAEMGDPQLVLTEGRAFYPGSSVRYTSWEFSQAIDIPANRAKTFLHFPGGSIVPALKAPY
jgi:hypothetical protein